MSGNNELGIIAASSIGQHDNSSGHEEEEEEEDDHLFIQDSFALAGTSIPATSPIGVSSCVHHLDKSKKHNNVLSRRISKLTKPEMSEHLEMQHLVDCDVDYENPSQIRSASKTSNCCSCPYLGLMLATLSSLFFSLCSVIVKGLVEVNPMELAAFRFVGVLLPAIPIVIWKREDPFPKGRRIMLILRSFVGTTGLMLSFYAFRHMPLADASVVVFSVPVFVAIFARIFLKEPCGFFNIITVCLTLIGVVLITRPPLIFGHAVESLTDSHVETERTDLWGAVAAFSATLFGANAYVLLRALKGLHFSVIMTNFGSFALIQTVTVTWAIGALCLPRCGTDRLLVVALAFLSFGGQILLTLALQMEQAGPVAIARSADIVFAFFWQVLFFNEIPNRYSVGGAVLVTSSVLLTGLRKWALSLPETSNIKKSLGILAM